LIIYYYGHETTVSTRHLAPAERTLIEVGESGDTVSILL